MRLIVLAAGSGTRLRPLTDDRPKCLVEVAGRTLLEWQIEAAARVGIQDVVVVGGHRAERLDGSGVRVVLNPAFETTNMVQSLFRARDFFGDGFIASYGDIAYSVDVLRELVGNAAPIGVAVDTNWRAYWDARFEDPLSDAESLRIDARGLITSIGRTEPDIDMIEAQFMGLVAFRNSGVTSLEAAYDTAFADERAGRAPFGSNVSLDRMFMTDLLQGLIDGGKPIAAVTVAGGWIEVDSMRDLAIAENLAHAGRLGASVRNAP